MERWTQDVKIAVRRLARTPAATAVIVTTLALGVGASAGVFSVFTTLVLDPLPFGDAHRLVRLLETVESPGEPARTVVVSGRNVDAWRQRSTAFAEMGAGRYRTLTLTGGGAEAERVAGIAATWDLFSTLDVEPVVGRTFLADEDLPGAPAPVALISHGLWTRRFGQDPAAVGAEIEIGGRPHTVVGVMPPGFRYPYSAEMWVPLGLSSDAFEWDNRRLNVSARLAPGVSVEQARRELETIAARLGRERPDTNTGSGVVVRTIREEVLEGVDRKVAALLWAAVFVLLIGAANVASMMLARAHRDERAVAVRVALGAGRRDLARQVTVEALLLSAAGAVAGLWLASLAAPALAGMSPVDDLGTFFQDIRVDRRAVGFGALAALAASLLFAVPSALHAAGVPLGRVLRAGGGAGVGRAQRRVLDGLVVAEVAVAVVLVTGAGLMARSAVNLSRLDLGVETGGLLTFGLSPSSSGYDLPERQALMTGLLERIRGLPGVEGAALTTLNPFRDQGWGARVLPEGYTPVHVDERLTVNHRSVTPGWFETAGTALLAGRTFLASDGADAAGVAVLSRSAAARFWPGQDAVGRRIREMRGGEEGPWLTVVGVVEDVVDYGDVTDTWYRPYAQDPREFATGVLEVFVRAPGPATPVYAAVRGAVAEVDPGLPVFNLEPVGDIVRFERRVETFTTLLLSVFAALGLALAAVGVFGVLSFFVGRRRREIALRLALGATPSDVVRDVLAGALRVAGAGLALGVVGAGVLTRFLEGFLFGVSPLAPEVYLGMAATVLAVAAGAAWLPALRATRVAPRVVLSED